MRVHEKQIFQTSNVTLLCHYASKSGRASDGHRTGKGQSSSQFPRRVVPKNVLPIRQLHSSPMLVSSCLKPCKLGFLGSQHYVNQELSDVKAGFRKGRGTRDPIADIHWIIERERELKKKKTQTNKHLSQTNKYH